MKRGILILLLLLAALALPAAALAQTIIGPDEVVQDDVAVFDEDLVIEEGAIVSGDVAVFNGQVVINGNVSGDVAVFNGDVTINGDVSGDVAIFNGNLTVGETAAFSGNCAVFNGALSGNLPDGADCVALALPFLNNVTGFVNRVGGDAPGLAGSPPPSSLTTLPQKSFWGEMAGTALASLFMGLLAFGAAAVFPQSLTRISRSARQKPLASSIVGFLTALAVPSLLLFLLIISIILSIVLIGLLGFPILFGLSLVYLLALLLGWLGVGTLFGGWLARLFRLKNRGVKSTAVLGVVALTFLLGALDALSLEAIRVVVTVLLLWLGLGAVALTKFGRRPYPPLPASRHESDEFDIQLPQKEADRLAAVLETLPDEANTLKN